MMGISILTMLLAASVSVGGVNAPARAQAGAGAQAGLSPSPGRVIGVVSTVDRAARQLTVKTDKGELVGVSFEEGASFRRVPPGSKTLEQAVAITFEEVGVGDRVFASGAPGGGKSVTARALIIISQADLAKKYERDREEWRRRGIVGTVTTLDAGKNELTVLARLPEGNRPLVVTAGGNARIRRYAAGSVKFDEAQPSALDAFKAGDQVRALGTRNVEGTGFTAEEIVGGTFRVVPGVINAADAASGEIKITDLQTQQALTVAVSADTLLRRLPPELLARLTQGSAGAAAAPGQPSAGVALDVREALERQPPVPVSELKAGDMAIIISAPGADPARLAAITFITGVDSLLAPLRARAQTPNRRPSDLNLGLPEGLSGLGVGLP